MAKEIKKYELTKESKTNLFGRTIFQIRALQDIERFGIKKGDLGGWVPLLQKRIDSWKPVKTAGEIEIEQLEKRVSELRNGK